MADHQSFFAGIVAESSPASNLLEEAVLEEAAAFGAAFRLLVNLVKRRMAEVRKVMSYLKKASPDELKEIIYILAEKFGIRRQLRLREDALSETPILVEEEDPLFKFVKGLGVEFVRMGVWGPVIFIVSCLTVLAAHTPGIATWVQPTAVADVVITVRDFIFGPMGVGGTQIRVSPNELRELGSAGLLSLFMWCLTAMGMRRKEGE